MKFTCLQEHLAKSLAVVEKAVGKATHLPSLTHILLEAAEGKLKLAATDLEIGITSWCQGKTEGEGVVSLPAKVLTGLVFSLAPEKMTLECRDDGCVVTSGGSRATLKGLKGEEFPLIPAIENEKPLSLEVKSFLGSSTRVIESVSPDTARPELTGVLFQMSQDALTLVATDSFRLTVAPVSVETGGIAPAFFQDHTLIVPGKTMRELVHALDPEGGAVLVTLDERQIQFAQDNHRVVSRLIEGAYPRYEDIIPASFLGVRRFELGALVRALRRLELFSGRLQRVEFFLGNDACIITSEDPNLGTASEKLGDDGEGPEQKFAFNIRYISQGLALIPGREVELAYNEPHTPVVFRAPEGAKGFYVVMPMKLES